ncbi:alpha-2-macroglobulin family protein [Flavihumibacter solisilvae]|uniref:alpha-2-macroglobulin family protein n=1 Tax=Flavihumibacter solisilvae TaxID=1349421 RepID=UPI0006893BF3|nr:MG2 domain-containing protein [Flavihumibacter solisilvae]
MYPRFVAFTAALSLLFIVSCNRKSATLKYTNADKEVRQLENLIFRFDHPLVSDSMLHLWDSTEYVLFEPAIPGKFRWESPDQLIFSPAAPLAPATQYKARLQYSLLAHSQFTKLEDPKELSFYTPSLNLDQTNITWILQDENSRLAVPQVELYFNYQVKPQLLKEKLKIESEGKQVNYSMLTVSPDNKITIRLQNFQQLDKDREISVVIDKGLLPLGGGMGTAKLIRSDAAIPSPFRLVINDLETEHDGSMGKIHVRTSQQIEQSGLAALVKLDPAVKFNTEITDDGFIVSGEQFDADKSYELTLAKGIRGILGGQLKEDYINNVAFGTLEPAIGFTSNKAVYLSSEGARNMEVRIINVPKIKLVISKIYESNLLAAQRYGYYPKETKDGRDEYYYEEGGDAMLGDVIYEAELETASLPKFGNSRLLNVNVLDRIPELKGIYHIKIRSAKDYWLADSRFVSLSDIGLVAKEGRDQMYVFANSIRSAKAISDLSVVAYGANNQVLGMGTTNADGVATLSYTRKDFAGFKPAMIVARSGGDFNYLPFNTTGVNTSRFEVGGKRLNPTGFDAFIYGERDIYRPGEKINFSVILRNAMWQSPGDLPVKFKFLMPNGKELKSFRKNLNAQGSMESVLDIPTAAITGNYQLEVYSGNDILLSSKSFMVEEFVPDRIKVSVKPDKNELKPGETVSMNVQAMNFFGPPAANRKYECEIQLKQKAFTSKKYSRYDFSITNQQGFFDKKVLEGKTDAAGNAGISYTVPDMFRNIGLLEAAYYTTVFDETGRPVSRITKIDIYTQQQFFGLASDGYDYFPLNQPIRFPLIAVDKNGNVLTGTTAKVEVIKHEYRTVLTKSDGYFRYDSQVEDKVVVSGNTTVSGEQSTYNFVPRSPGNYEIRVSVPGSGSYVSRKFYSYGYWGGDINSFEVNNEGQIEIETDKPVYRSGETVKLLFKTPFSGRMLVTMEKDRLLHYQYIDVNNRSATLDLKLTAEHLPNVYIAATLIKPHTVSDIPLTVAHGYQSVRVEEPARKQQVEIVAKESVRSATRQKITVRAEEGSMVTLAAVDNGVLQVTDFETPDPYKYFYGRRALDVNSFDLYPLLFPELKAKLSSTGGDASMKMDQRVNPIPNKRIKILSYWSGIRPVGKSGEISFDIDIPRFSGEMRLMAVTYKNDRFGAAEKAIKVADPLVISTAMPRFMSPKDSISVPVTISNTTSKATTANAVITVTGPLQVAGVNTQSLSIPANSEASIKFGVVAKAAIEAGQVKIDVQAMGEKFTELTDITVRPASTLQQRTGSGVIAANKSESINISAADFIPSSANYRLVVSRSPALEIANQLNYLVQYPYGCTEQAISSAFPQVYFTDMAELLHNSNVSVTSAHANVMEAIRKIKMRQLYSGAITLWEDAGSENWWTSVYAAHFLIEAKAAGFDVDPSLTASLLSFINNRLASRSSINYYYNRNQQKKIAPKEVAYSLYVLALAGKPNVSVMNYYKARPDQLSLDSRYLLAAAYALSGDKLKSREILPPAFTGEESVPQTGGSFYSDIRDEAIALHALATIDPNNAQVPVMARHVVSKLKQRRWYSTQESAFSFLAIGKLAAKAKKTDIKASIKVNGKQVGELNNNSVQLSAKDLKGTNIEVQTKGTGQLYYWWQSEGISQDGSYKEEDSYLKVRRRFFDRNGQPLAGHSFQQNDLVIVQLSLDKSFAGTIENIVITDLLPAGFEIENPRTKEIPGMDWIKDASTPTSMDVRDDRLNLFVDAEKSHQVYYYAIRAVSPGTYQLGPVSADAMYNGEYHSYHGAGKIVIRP